MPLFGERDVASATLFETRAALALNEACHELRHVLDCEVEHGPFSKRVVPMVDRVGPQELAGLVNEHRRQHVFGGSGQRKVFEPLPLLFEALLEAPEKGLTHRKAASRVEPIERRANLLWELAHAVDVRVLLGLDL